MELRLAGWMLLAGSSGSAARTAPLRQPKEPPGRPHRVHENQHVVAGIQGISEQHAFLAIAIRDPKLYRDGAARRLIYTCAQRVVRSKGPAKKVWIELAEVGLIRQPIVKADAASTFCVQWFPDQQRRGDVLDDHVLSRRSRQGGRVGSRYPAEICDLKPASAVPSGHVTDLKDRVSSKPVCLSFKDGPDLRGQVPFRGYDEHFPVPWERVVSNLMMGEKGLSLRMEFGIYRNKPRGNIQYTQHLPPEASGGSEELPNQPTVLRCHVFPRKLPKLEQPLYRCRRAINLAGIEHSPHFCADC